MVVEVSSRRARRGGMRRGQWVGVVVFWGWGQLFGIDIFERRGGWDRKEIGVGEQTSSCFSTHSNTVTT